jgi:hypothetical protein
MMVEQFPEPDPLRLRQAVAWPMYLLSLILDYASVALARLAAWIAGDPWPG